MPSPAKYRKKVWQMANGNQQWVSDIAVANIDKIYEFLEEKTLKARAEGKRPPSFTYQQIAYGSKVYPRSVSYLCRVLAFKADPVVIIQCGHRKNMVFEKVKLLRVIHD